MLLILFGLLLMIGIAAMMYGDANAREGLVWFGLILVITFALTLFLSITIAVVENANPEVKYNSDYLEYQTIKYEDANDYVTFAEDVSDYNKKVYLYKRFGKSPWIGMFYYTGCEDLPYYKFDGFIEPKI